MATAAPANRSGSPASAIQPLSERRPAVVIVVLALAGMLAALQQTLVVPLIPDLPEILGVGAPAASWTVTITLLSAAVTTPIVSRLADMVGKRRMVLAALSTSTVGSVLVAVIDSFPGVVTGRALQGVAASLIPVGISIMRDALPRERVGFAVALMSATLGIGSALGLPLSGVLYGHFGFASIFWVAAMSGAVLTAAVLLLVPESQIRTPARFDYLGAVLISIALTSVLLAVSKAGEWGWTSSQVLGLFSAAVLTLAVWFPYQLRVNEPMIDLRTAARRPVLLTNLGSFFVAIALYINLLVSGQHLQMPTSTGYGFGLTVIQSGAVMMPTGLAMVLLSPLSGRLLNRLGGRITLLMGAAIMSAAYVFRVFATSSVAEIVIGTSLVGVGGALAFAAMPTLIMANVPITESAAANGLNSLMRALGGAASSAVLAAVLASTSVTTHGHPVPTLAGFEAMYWIGSAVALVAFGLGSIIPTRRKAALSTAASGAGAETVVRGRILPGGRVVDRLPAIVTVTRLDGEPVDWARADNDGRYSVALPGFGRYLLVASARGWAPHAEIFDFEGSADELELELTEELALTGLVTWIRQPVPDALVILHAGNGEFVSTAATDADGHFIFPLPPPGTYILTAVIEDGRRAQAMKTSVNALATAVDIEVGA